jgi:DNA mismatch endonuclease, patch repair protein
MPSSMTDVLSREHRSRVMTAIRSSGNRRTEMRLIDLFKERGIKGWRRRQPLAGKPDFVFRKEKIAVFVDGCFWHGCKRHCRMPKSQTAYWVPKIARNKLRDVEVSRLLRREGWLVQRIWEHSLKNPQGFLDRLEAILASRR